MNYEASSSSRFPNFLRENYLRLPYVLTAVWVLCMIAIPIVLWTLGEAAMHHLINVSVLLQAAAVLTFLVETWTWQRVAGTAVCTCTFGITSGEATSERQAEQTMSSMSNRNGRFNINP